MCYEICPVGTYSIGQSCEECDLSCQECIDIKTKCTACPEGKYLFNNECLENCPERTVRDGNICRSECESGQFLYRGICYTKCPKGTFGSGEICDECDTSCAECEGIQEHAQIVTMVYIYMNQNVLIIAPINN
ncbi:hypothetical protein M9Y10_014805 [Tritrichomonas musculus]|uniref:Furin-like cysteine-rich domain-containing protein n=1 Tax=Tritrichomonas musculus TaxID=1915356 RepID=A0ABR2L0I5_9EUKA